MNKEQQKELLIEIMEADERDGLYNSDISKMETTQTAVEWLYNLSKQREVDKFDLIQAKQMEKDQIMNAWKDGDNDLMLNTMAEQYYNKAYGK